MAHGAERNTETTAGGEEPLAAAREWLELGVRVVVCEGKNPGALLGLNWQHQATDDEARLCEWLARWPNANLGVVPGDALLLVDVDDPAKLTELEATLGPAPPTPRYYTNGDPNTLRERLVLRHPGVELRRLSLGDGIEVRAGDLMSVVPPSVNPKTGEHYEWRVALDEAPVCALPSTWVDYAKSRNGRRSAAAKVGPAIPEGARNDALVSLAGTMRRRGMAEAAIAAALKVENANRCKPPLPEDEVERIAASVARYPPAEPEREVDSRQLGEVLGAFERRLYLPDLGIVTVTLGALAANLLNGDPVWLVNVGPPSSGKTEVLMACTVLPDVHPASTLTEAALLSGTPQKERAKGARGGLLPTIGEFGLIVCKDLTSILSMRHDTQAQVLGALREVYDGEYTRHVGTDGGRQLRWSGKVGLLAGCTETIDRRQSVMAAMGERFTLYRHGGFDAKDQARGALDAAGGEAEMREELRTAVGGLFRDGLPSEPLPLSEDDRERLVSLAAFAVRCRSAVERDGYSREIELVPHAELPARLVKVLARTIAGLDSIGVARADAWPLVTKMGLDSIPALRLAAINVLADADEELATDAIGVEVGHPTQTTRRALEDLEAHGVLDRDTAGKAHRWRLSEWCRDEYREVKP